MPMLAGLLFPMLFIGRPPTGPPAAIGFIVAIGVDRSWVGSKRVFEARSEADISERNAHHGDKHRFNAGGGV